MFTKDDLRYNHYSWFPGATNTTVLDNKKFARDNGHNVVSFINLFAMLYIPNATIEDCNRLEFIIINYLPVYISTFSDAAFFIAKMYDEIRVFPVLMDK